MTIVAVYHYVSPLLWDLVIEAVMIMTIWCFVRPVLPKKIQPMSCDDHFMPIFPTLRELLLRTVFQDWIVDDGNYITQAVVTLIMAIMTPLTISEKVCFKTLLAV